MDESTEKQPVGPNEDQNELLPSKEELFQVLFEEVPCYTCILDSELNIIAANRLCKENFTTPFTRHCYQVMKDKGEPCEICPAKKTLEEGCINETHELFKHASGGEIGVICRTAPIRDGSGKITGVLHMSACTGQADELQQVLTSLNSQIGAVSHGIKGLLTSMVGGFYLWDSGHEKGRADRVEKGVDIIRRSFHRLQHLAHDVLFFVKHRTMHLEPLAVSSILNDMVLQIEDMAGYMGTEVTVADLPDKEIIIQADRRAIVSALSNLVISSLHDCYTDKRDIPHTVRISVKEQKKEVVFEVIDNGVGMDPDSLKKLFSLFFNPKGIEAAGIGLYITNKLARAHKGRVKVDSKLGRGTHYWLYLPFEPQEAKSQESK
ncbi:MAG: ATP-binding protein [Planctomycetota bacterium]